jgi:four helix bundle protein
MQLVSAVYRETSGFPVSETYGLTSQMRRAAVSIPSNIAEGKGRNSDADRSRFFAQARGSLLELETQIQIARELVFLPSAKEQELIRVAESLGRMLNSLLSSLKTSRNMLKVEDPNAVLKSGLKV